MSSVNLKVNFYTITSLILLSMYGVGSLMSGWMILNDLMNLDRYLGGLVATLFAPVLLVLLVGIIAHAVYLKTENKTWWWIGWFPALFLPIAFSVLGMA